MWVTSQRPLNFRVAARASGSSNRSLLPRSNSRQRGNTGFTKSNTTAIAARCFLLDDVGWMDPGSTGGGVAGWQRHAEYGQARRRRLLLTSAYSTPSCSPSRASIHTGQNPLHHGILRPPMYGEAGGLDGAITMPMLLKQQGYVTQGVGKWHMGENQGSQPQNVGYDDYVGFLGVSDMYTEWRDEYFNPEVARCRLLASK